MSFEEQRDGLRRQFHRNGWTWLYVEADRASLSWAYTIGLCRKGQPELVVVGQPHELVNRTFHALVPRLLGGRTLDAGSSVEVEGHRWTTRSLDRAVIEAGLLAWWPDVFPHCECHALPDAVELVDVEVLRAFDDENLPQPSSSEGRSTTRAARRRTARAEAKRSSHEG